MAIKSYIRLIRVRHWIKNVFILAPLIFSLNLLKPLVLLKTVGAFVAFCLMASSVYIFNDIIDRDRDRQHPTKRNRPLACGSISIIHAAFVGIILLFFSVGMSFLASPGILFVLGGYFVLNILYSLFLKRIVIFDVMVVAFGFLLRIIAGAVAIGVATSRWILLTTLFLSLFLGFCKRSKEIHLDDEYANHRPVLEHYSIALLNSLIIICITLTIIAYSLYIMDPQTVARLGTDMLIVTIPLVLFGLFRYLFVVYKKDKGGDPVEVIIAEPAIMIDIALWGVVTLGILYLL